MFGNFVFVSIFVLLRVRDYLATMHNVKYPMIIKHDIKLSPYSILEWSPNLLHLVISLIKIRSLLRLPPIVATVNIFLNV